MDNKIAYEYENFEIHLRKANQAKIRNDYFTMGNEYTSAAACLYAFAKKATGNWQKVLTTKGDKFILLAKNCYALHDTKSNVTNEQKNVKLSKDGNDSSGFEKTFETIEIPNVSFDDVAGLDDVKKSVEMRVILPLKHPDLASRFKIKMGGGILLYGLPGTGKTMIAKAIAHETKANFFSIKCSDIVSKWFGEAEQNIKRLFEEARKHERAIIFFDEFEALATKRGGSSTVMNRVVPELLAQIQGFNENDTNKMLLILAATNCPWNIDSAMLRPGRFNELIYVPLPDYESRLAILNKNLISQEIPIDKNISLEDIAKKFEGFNGSDVAEFCERVKLSAFFRSATNPSSRRMILQEDIDSTLNNIHSSVQQSDIKDLERFMNKNRSN